MSPSEMKIDVPLIAYPKESKNMQKGFIKKITTLLLVNIGEMITT